jgi:hypothetical protein
MVNFAALFLNSLSVYIICKTGKELLYHGVNKINS